MGKIPVNLRLDIAYIRAIHDLKNRLNLDTLTSVIEEAIRRLLLDNGMALKGDCPYRRNIRRNKGRIEVYCSNPRVFKGDWVDYKNCLNCKEWF